jgi:hypothetical protein
LKLKKYHYQIRINETVIARNEEEAGQRVLKGLDTIPKKVDRVLYLKEESL